MEDDFTKMTDEELIGITVHPLNNVIHKKAKAELLKRQIQRENERHIDLKKPHWSLTPSFIVILLTMLFAAIAAWPVIRSWFQPSPSVNINSSFQSPQSCLKTGTQGEQKK